MAVKRRIVWLSDEEWAALGSIAQANKSTVSAMIRSMIESPTERRPHMLPVTNAKDAQAKRDAILRGVNRK